MLRNEPIGLSSPELLRMFDETAPATKVHRRYERHAEVPPAERSKLVLFRAGWACRCLIHGDGTRQILGLLLPGDVCGSNENGAGVTLIALSAVEVTELEGISDADGALAASLLRHAAQAHRLSQRWVARLGRRSASERVADLLIELSERLEQIGAGTSGRYPFPLTQYDLADAAGLTAIHVNRVLRDMRALGILSIRQRELEILSPEALQAMSARAPAA